MKRTMVKAGIAALALAGAGVAGAQGSMGSPNQPTVPIDGQQQPSGIGQSGAQVQLGPQPLKPGPEDEAIAPLFGSSGTFVGQVPANALGPGSKATSSHGRVSCNRIADGLWFACDVYDNIDSPQATPYVGHYVIGYDRQARQYRASVADNQGAGLYTMNGTLNGKQFALETPTDINMNGRMMRDRLTFDFSDPNTITWRDEQKMGDQPWKLFESATMQVTRTARQARMPMMGH